MDKLRQGKVLWFRVTQCAHRRAGTGGNPGDPTAFLSLAFESVGLIFSYHLHPAVSFQKVSQMWRKKIYAWRGDRDKRGIAFFCMEVVDGHAHLHCI